MFRASKAEEGSRTVITIDGQLSGDSIEVVGNCCDEAVSTGKRVQLFLRDVSAVDQAGRDLLCRLAAKGVRVIASGVYTSYLVRALLPAGADPVISADAGGPMKRVR
jgi:hypothetical protein